MKVLLVNPPDALQEMFGVGQAFIQKYEPLGLLYIAAVARERGHEVSVVDAYAEDITQDELIRRIEAHGPDVVGISTLTCNGAVVFEVGQWIERHMPDTLVVLGNVHASVFHEAYLRHGAADVVVHGEGELTFAAIVEHHERGASLHDIVGISFLEGDQVVRTGPGQVVQDLASLPLPARDLVDQSRYRLTEISNQNFVTDEGQVAKTMLTSRGCPNRCTFCVVHMSRKPRNNDPIAVVDEMELLQKEYDAAYVYIMDPLFMNDKARVFAITEEYERRGLTIKWGGDAHVATISPELVRAMDSANCFELSLGIESGVQRLLKIVKKGTKLDRIRRSVEIIKANSDIQVEGLFILGLPSETYEESLQTIDFACSLPLDMAQFSILCPYPGSPIFDELAARGEIETGIRPDGSVDTEVWKRYSSYIIFTDNEPIWTTPTLTADQLRGLQKKALRRFYWRPRQVLRQLKRIRPSNVVDIAKIALKGFF